MSDWENWAKTVEYEDLEEVYRPEDLAELKESVQEAAGNRWRLRAVGSGHAWSNLGVPTRCRGAIIRTDRLCKYRGVTNGVVEVEGGIKIEDLNEKLFKEGYALENLGDANPQAIAGAISTETHGSGVNLGSLSELIEGMTIVTADGRERTWNATDPDQEKKLRAARVSLGQLGAIYSLRLRVRPSYFLNHKQKLVPFGPLTEGQVVDDLLMDNRHLEYWSYPYTGKAERIVRNIVDSTEEINSLSLVSEWFLQRTGSRLINLIGKKTPEKLPELFKGQVNEDNLLFKPIERQGPWHEILLGKSNIWKETVETFTLEYQFAYEKLWDAFEHLEASIGVAKSKCVFVASPIQIRFTKQSERSILSHMRHQPTVSFSVSFFREHDGAHTWLPELEQRFLDIGGLPHWGKMYYTRPEKPQEFEDIRQELDPNGTFAFEQSLYRPDPEAFQKV